MVQHQGNLRQKISFFLLILKVASNTCCMERYKWLLEMKVRRENRASSYLTKESQEWKVRKKKERKAKKKNRASSYLTKESHKPKIERLLDPEFKRPLGRYQREPRMLALIEVPSPSAYLHDELYNTIALTLARSSLTQLPEPFDYPNLEELDASKNLLTSIPRGIVNCIVLQRLYLQQNLLTTIPRSIGQLDLLVLLDIANNRIKKLPQELGMLTRLVYLDVSHNKITELPEAVLNLQQLEYLYITANRIPAEQYSLFHDKLPSTKIDH